MPIAVPIAGTSTVTTLANVRQGAPSIKSPILRKLGPSSPLAVSAIVIGDAIAGNAHWFEIGNNTFIWSGACSELNTAASSTFMLSGALDDDQRVAGFGLISTFSAKVVQLLDLCKSQGMEFKVAQGLRTPQTQAQYYCEWAKRPSQTLEAEADKVESLGAPWIANLLRQYIDTPKKSEWQTSQIPGSGWHQWGEAADCYCYRNNVMVTSGDDPCYKKYADLAQSIGLTAGFYFSKRDPGHVQLRPEAGASDVYTWGTIDNTMKSRFSGKPSIKT